MKPYRDIDGGGGITHYQEGAGHLTLRFASGSVYRFSHQSAGTEHVAAMQSLARAGRGLHGYLKKHQPLFESKDHQ